MSSQHKVGLLFLLLVAVAFGQDDIGCFAPGECVESVALTELAADLPSECLSACKEYEHEGTGDFECNYFTFYFDSNVGNILFLFSVPIPVHLIAYLFFRPVFSMTHATLTTLVVTAVSLETRNAHCHPASLKG